MRPTVKTPSTNTNTQNQANLPTELPKSQPPAFLKDVDMKGAGVSSRARDNLLPMVKVLQPLSPEVLPNNPAQIKGAAAGDIVVSTLSPPLIPGDEGFLFQPCYAEEAIVEWKARGQGGGGGGGFVRRLPVNKGKPISGTETEVDLMPEDAEQVPDPRAPDKMIWKKKGSSNLYVHTKYMAGFIITPEAPCPAYIPFSSTGHTVVKGWNTKMSLKFVEGKPADSFAIYYRVFSKVRNRADQTWFVLDPQDAGEPDERGLRGVMYVPTVEDYNRGKTLHTALSAGEVKLAEESSSTEEAETASQDGKM